MSPRPFRILALAVAAVASAVLAAPAAAGVLVADAPDCADRSMSQVFLPWLDVANYVAAPDGGLEAGGAGWTLAGAAVVDGNEAFSVGGADDRRSLALPDGAAATTATMCVGLEHPTVRFFVRQTGGGPLAALRVDALVEDAAGEVRAIALGATGAGSSWQPSPAMVLSASLLPLLPGSHTPVALRFVARGGDFAVDDVYVDPYTRN